VSHVAPGKAQLKIDLNDLYISPCVRDIAAFPHDLLWFLIIPFHKKVIFVCFPNIQAKLS